MARRAQGQVLGRETAKGITWALRFQAYGKRHYLTLGSQRDGWSRERAEEELRSVLADVGREIWIPPTRAVRPIAMEAGRSEETDFHRFASDWLASRKGEIGERSLAYYRWALQYHLLPYFADWGLREIDVDAVDGYRRFKVLQSEKRRAAPGPIRPKPGRHGSSPRALSAATINKTIEVLQGVLSLALEYGHIERNPAVGRRRRLKLPPTAPVYLDTIEQIEALFEGARRLDAGRTSKLHDRLPLVGVLLLAGLRVGEVCGLRWRDLDLANARLRVARSKTQAGLRQVTLLPLLRDQLDAHRVVVGETDPDDHIFPNGSGRARDKDNLRNRVLDPVLVETDKILISRGHPPLPGRITPHKLRHTFASILMACGEDPTSVMAQLGHTDPRFTLRVYAHRLSRGAGQRRRLKALVYGSGGGQEQTIGWRGLGGGHADAP
jgi:integrase